MNPKPKQDSVTLPLTQFLELVESAAADCPVWALTLAYHLDGARRRNEN
jgi:hypothetical protein